MKFRDCLQRINRVVKRDPAPFTSTQRRAIAFSSNNHASLEKLSILSCTAIRAQSTNAPKPTPTGFWDRLAAKYGPQTCHAPDGYNRWKVVPLAVSTHLCLGGCYAWSIFNEPLTRELGGVISSSADWELGGVMTNFVAIILAQGTAMALLGKWVQRVGPRIAGLTGSSLYAGGTVLGSVGVMTHTLPLVYLGYGLIGGAGMGIAYLPPVATLLSWFPDRRGLASGMAICGFGGGAILIIEVKKRLMKQFFEAPTYLGSASDVATERMADGRLMATVSNKLEEVVTVSTQELSKIGADHLQEGIYLVGTGNTGVAAAMGCLGLGYGLVTLTSASLLKTPRPGWLPESMRRNDDDATSSTTNAQTATTAIVPKNVHVDDVMKLPQFWAMWGTFVSTATVGMGLMSCAKDVLNSCFATPYPALVTGAFAATYVQALSTANLGGRIGWATVSDKIGRKNTFILATGLGAPICFGLPLAITAACDPGTTSYVPLAFFYGGTWLVISFFGAGYSTLPAYESDLFGTKYVGPIHGRMMTASAVSGLAGPKIFSVLHASEERKAIDNLAALVDPATFQEKFGAPMESLSALVDAKAVTINRLLELCPPGTTDPTPFLYDPAFKTMAGVMIFGGLCNLAVRPVDAKWHEKE